MKKNIIIVFIIVVLVCVSVYLIDYSKKQTAGSVTDENTNIEGQTNNDTEKQVEENKDETVKTIVTLYFLNPETNKLDQEKREVDMKALLDQPEVSIVTELLKGPAAINLRKVLPDETKLNKIVVQGNKAMVDFDSTFNGDNPTKEVLTERIDCVTKSLCELKDIDKVEISIDGKVIE